MLSKATDSVLYHALRLLRPSFPCVYLVIRVYGLERELREIVPGSLGTGYGQRDMVRDLVLQDIRFITDQELPP